MSVLQHFFDIREHGKELFAELKATPHKDRLTA